MSDQMSRRGFMGAAATGAFALAGVALAGCSSTSASSEKSSEKEKAVKPVILVTSFGTSYNDSRHITIGAIEDAIREKYWQDYDIRRAFTAQIIIDKLKKRDGITIDNMTEALDRCVEDGVKEIVVQPTHLMAGLEYTDVKDELDKYADKFDKISLGDPLLTSDDDYKKVAAAMEEVRATGYGIVIPDAGELELEEPEIIKQGGRYGVRLRAKAPSIHMIRADIQAEVSPIVGSEKQSEDMLGFLLQEFEGEPERIWQSNIFGRSFHELINEDLASKLKHMPEDAREKMRQTLEKIINEGSGGLICIIL